MKRFALATMLGESVGKYVAEQFRADIGQDIKPDGSIVTDADKEAERMIRSAIREAFPDDAIVGEEYEYEKGISGITWYIDPIDGTTNFANHIPLFGVSIGYADEDGGLGGVIQLPMLNSLYAASRGEGATLNGDPIHISGTWSDTRPLISYSVANKEDQRIAKLHQRKPRPRMRAYGSIAIALSFFSEGAGDGAFFVDQKPWDYAAGVVIAKEAGAVIIPMDGKPTDLPAVASFLVVASEHADAFKTFMENL